MKVAMIGVGGMGGVHYGEYKNIKDAEIVAVCDVRLDMLKEKTEGDNVRLYTDYREMLEKEKPELVDVCTPTYLHAEPVIAALESGAHVICEKPMAISLEDTKRMIEAAEKSGKLLMIAQVVRFMQAYAYLRDVIKSEKYGKLVHMDMKRISGTPMWSWEDWMRDEKKSGHMMLDLMIHDIDYMQSIFGAPKDVNGLYHPLKNNSNYAQTNYIYDDFTVSIVAGWFNGNPEFDMGATAIFQDGYVIVDNGKVIDNGEEVNFEDSGIASETGINLSNVDGYACEIMYFMDCIKNGKKPEMSLPESAAYSVQMVKETLKKITIV